MLTDNLKKNNRGIYYYTIKHPADRVRKIEFDLFSEYVHYCQYFRFIKSLLFSKRQRC